MPSAEARTAGENTRLASGSAWHQVRSTSSPNAVSAAPYGAGLAAGSVYATPRATVGAVTGDDPVPVQPASMATSTTGTRAPRTRCHRMLPYSLPAAAASFSAAASGTLVMTPAPDGAGSRGPSVTAGP